MRLFTRQLRDAEPRRMLDHINYMQNTLEQKNAQRDTAEREMKQQLAELKAALAEIRAQEG